MTQPLRPIMVLGCTSDAGKSWIATGLCRWFARRGVRVAPFKAQNMSNNARVVHGGEIGVAQWLQALAARVEPTVLMNPVLLKPEADTRSQVVANGRPDLGLTNTPWRQRADALWPAMAEAFDELRLAHDLVVIEGAGSPAEINLQDLVNNRMIDHADAAGLLVADIDRGGAFAHLFGTWSLVPPPTQRRLATRRCWRRGRRCSPSAPQCHTRPRWCRPTRRWPPSALDSERCGRHGGARHRRHPAQPG